jgi:hypothetical protein
MPSALILTDCATDPVPWLVAAAFGRSGGTPATVLDTGTLISTRWDLRVSAAGRATGGPATSPAGPEDDPAVLWCRASVVPVGTFTDPGDRGYAAAELRALVQAWLHSLGSRLVNAIDGEGLTGPSWTATRWLAEGARSGLPTWPLTLTTSARAVSSPRRHPGDGRLPGDRQPAAGTATVLVVGEHTYATLPWPLRQGALRLARRSRCRVLEAAFARHEDQWLMVSCDPAPALRTPAHLDAVAALMAGIAGRSGQS